MHALPSMGSQEKKQRVDTSIPMLLGVPSSTLAAIAAAGLTPSTSSPSSLFPGPSFPISPPMMSNPPQQHHPSSSSHPRHQEPPLHHHHQHHHHHLPHHPQPQLLIPPQPQRQPARHHQSPFSHHSHHLPPAALGATSPMMDNSASYELIVRQEPNRARMCGFGTKDYRPVDPAPILQLVRREGDGISPDFKQCTTLICHASLWSADGTEERGVVLNPGSATARRTEALFAGTTSDHGVSNLSTLSPSNYVSVLVGSLVSPCHILTDVDGHKALFFTFADLSIRTGGQYRLKFFLYDITRDASNAIASAMSNVIAVYPPKTFPGMTESSQLAKCLARQGIKLHIRTDMRRNSRPLYSAGSRELNSAASHYSHGSSSGGGGGGDPSPHEFDPMYATGSGLDHNPYLETDGVDDDGVEYEGGDPGGVDYSQVDAGGYSSGSVLDRM